MSHPAPAGPLPDLAAEADRVLAAARERGVVVRLAGGLAIRHLCPSARVPPLSREYHDLDLAIAGGGSHRGLGDLLVGLGYEADAMFNALNGSTRLQFNDRVNDRHVDVFVDAVRMCHVIEFKDRLGLLDATLSPADLLLTKLQIVELNDKDLRDLMALLHDIPVERGDAGIDIAYLETVWSDDWPLWRTSKLTLEKVERSGPAMVDAPASAKVLAAVARLRETLDAGRKTLRWRLRARVGDRIRWYELPEEVG